LKRRIAFSIPIGGVISFSMLMYMILSGVWNDTSVWIHVLVVLLFMFMSLVGWIEYERTVDS